MNKFPNPVKTSNRRADSSVQLLLNIIKDWEDLEMRKKYGGNKEIWAAALLVAGLFWLAGNVQAEGSMQAEIAEKILRFHVRANSDSEHDQQVKEEVRDAVGSYIEPKLTDASSLEETKAIVEENIDGIVEAAERVLKKEGEDYTAEAFLTRTRFPVKTYGSYTFPAGEYEALEVVLGEGNGHNWWCVLYPNMCFRGSVYEIVAEEAEEALREVLTAEEYQEVFDSGKFEIRWKFLEYFK